jgi:hypothetical protein
VGALRAVLAAAPPVEVASDADNPFGDQTIRADIRSLMKEDSLVDVRAANAEVTSATEGTTRVDMLQLGAAAAAASTAAPAQPPPASPRERRPKTPSPASATAAALTPATAPARRVTPARPASGRRAAIPAAAEPELTSDSMILTRDRPGLRRGLLQLQERARVAWERLTHRQRVSVLSAGGGLLLVGAVAAGWAVFGGEAAEPTPADAIATSPPPVADVTPSSALVADGSAEPAPGTPEPGPATPDGATPPNPTGAGADASPPGVAAAGPESDTIAAPVPEPAPGTEEPAPPVPEPAADAPPSTVGFFSLSSRPKMEVSIDGRDVGSTPVRRLRLSTGQHSVKVKNGELGLSRSLRIMIQPGETTTEEVVINRGTVIFNIAPWAEVYIGNDHLGMTPMPPKQLWPGTYNVTLVNPELKVKKKIKVTVKSDQTTKVVEKLK